MVTFLTTHFGEWKDRWHGLSSDEARSGASLLSAVPKENEGALAIFDRSTGQCLTSITLDTPAGFGLANGEVFVASMYGNRILRLSDTLVVEDVLSHRLMNDLHSLVIRPNGHLLMTSSGVDAVIEIDSEGDLAWIWFASAHDFVYTPRGGRRRIDARRDYRLMRIDTIDQSTHCNSAVPAKIDGEDVILVTLFHQGELIAIYPESGRQRTLVSGMTNPHAVRPRPGGWMVCDSRPGALVLLDESFWVVDLIEHGFNWVQDAIAVTEDRLLIADANHSRIVEWDIPTNDVCSELKYPEEWKVYQVEVLDESWACRLRDRSPHDQVLGQ